MGGSSSREAIPLPGVEVPPGLSRAERDKFIRRANIEKKIRNEDPDSTVKFNISSFPINDLLNSDSFITMYPDILDIIFYNPGLVKILKKFGTADGFICSINSMKTVKLADWITGTAKLDTRTGELDQIRQFLVPYLEANIFNALLKNTVPDENGSRLDPQEYFDEVAFATAESISKCVKDENAKPSLLGTKVMYSIYPISESITKDDLLTNKGILVTLSGNIGIEKVSGSLLKKGNISVLIDMSVKVVVFNSYIMSKRGLTLALNGIRERKRINRSELLDQEMERLSNEVNFSGIQHTTVTNPGLLSKEGLKRKLGLSDKPLTETISSSDPTGKM